MFEISGVGIIEEVAGWVRICALSYCAALPGVEFSWTYSS